MAKTAMRRKIGPSAATIVDASAPTVLGVSRRSWAHALQAAVKQMTKVAPRVTGVDVTRTHAVVAAGKIVEFRVYVAVTPASHTVDAVPHTTCCEPW